MKGLKTLITKEPKKAGKDWKLIGFHDSPDVNSELILLSIALERDKTSLLREAAQMYLRIFDPAKRAAAEIRRKLLTGPGKLNKDSLKEIEKLLHKKGVSKKYIEKVIKELK